MAQTALAAAVQSLPYVQNPGQRRHASKHRFFVVDLSQALFDFVIQLLPTAEEMAVKEDVRKLLERLIRTIEPDSRLLSFGSTANGFSLRNSDMDLCCLIDSGERLSASDLVTMLGDLLERETKFHVKPLPHARIPIVKLSLDPSPGLPSGIACDIGFENRLALENTRLLMCYAMIDPTRVRTLVLFLKVWSKRRKINSPYQGTLSSYGYVLLVIYFLVHVKNPPVLPNLQQMPPLRPISQEDTHIGGHNTWFFDDIELLCQRWQSSNTESVAELLIDFFRYYSRDFSYNTGVASIRAGLLKKESKGWQNDLSNSKFNDARERNRFCIEDPFETDFNVARCVTKEGLYQIRGEFMRASRILAMRPRAIMALSQLCEEKVGDPQTAPPPSIFVPPRLSFPPQIPYTVGSGPVRPKGVPERLSPQPEFFEPGKRTSTEQCVPNRSPPEHMAPKRSQWTSPPPPEAPLAHHAMFEDQLDQGLALATASSAARESGSSIGSGDSTEILSDEERRSDAAESDDVHSIQSFNERSLSNSIGAPSSVPTIGIVPSLNPRGRVSSRPSNPMDDQAVQPISDHEAKIIAYKAELLRRSHSGPPNRKASNRFSWPSASPIIYPVPATFQTSPSLRTAHLHVPVPPPADTSTVFYETTATQSRFSPHPHQQHYNVNVNAVNLNAYPISGSQLSSTSPYQRHLQMNEPGESLFPSLEHEISALHLSGRGFPPDGGASPRGEVSPSSPYTQMPFSHAHTPSTVTITSATSNSLSISPSTYNYHSSSPPLAQLAQRHMNNSGASPKSHSPLRTSAQRGIPRGTSPNRNTNLSSHAHHPHPNSFSYGSDSSPPSSTSLSPLPSPTLLHPHEELPRYSSPQSPMPMSLKLGTPSGLKPHVNMRRSHQHHTVPPDPGSVDLTGSPPSVTPLR
ncbi:hypothetical protein HYDPIDRAFT_31815 [Hydnomerulius pinastri MD-312]|uniref:polynucleotide adenylyltransferase n=1 Tax=Hydnomerulius pinastri MD-312 TaxID=994086 RepID=A0A0C9WBM0_9AGAM|nr:hypothetical protein HYDPIDRAFT_31815 [Hydnomerulius pinastri MD-312]